MGGAASGTRRAKRSTVSSSGAVADEFMAFVKNQLENFDANQV